MKLKAKKFFEIFQRILFFVPALIWASLIFYFSSIPGNALPPLFPGADMIFHFFEYFIFCGLIFFGLKNYLCEVSQISVKKILLLALAIACFYAITDEFHQLFVPGREASIFDFLIDAVGATTFSLIKLFVNKIG